MCVQDLRPGAAHLAGLSRVVEQKAQAADAGAARVDAESAARQAAGDG
jgi:hypothetical protein